MNLQPRSRSLWAPVLLLGAVASIFVLAAAPAKKKPAAGGASRGEYLVSIMGCGDCHTPGTLFGAPDMSRMLSGSELGWQGPWGVSYARNLTPDMETGIGLWKNSDIVKAIRHGVRPDGTALLPPMPWQAFTRLTDEDANAIAAYLKTIPAVKHKVPDKLAPEAKPTGSFIVFPAPSAWDAPKSAPPEGSK